MRKSRVVASKLYMGASGNYWSFGNHRYIIIAPNRHRGLKIYIWTGKFPCFLLSLFCNVQIHNIIIVCVCLKLMIIIYVLICKKCFLVQNIYTYLPWTVDRKTILLMHGMHSNKLALRFNKGLKAEMIMVQVSKHKTNN